jgi:hypothetical protein
MKQHTPDEHPTHEEWMSFLYREDTPAQRAARAAHLRVCPPCQAQVKLWRQSQQALDAWALPSPAPRQPGVSRPFLRWAAAAVIVLGLGVGLGRLTSPAALEAGAVRRALEAELDAKLAANRSELLQVLNHHQTELAQALRSAAADAATSEAGTVLAQYAKLLEEQRDADHESYLAAFRQLDERRRSDVGSLREQIQTVALNADDGLTRTQEQLLELASATRPSNP